MTCISCDIGNNPKSNDYYMSEPDPSPQGAPGKIALFLVQ